MAGLGESCSYVASLLWAIGTGVDQRDLLTQKAAYWVMPAGVKSALYAPVKDIKFIGKKGSAIILGKSL